MASGGFNVPVGGHCAGDEGNAALVFSCCIRAVYVVTVAGLGVDSWASKVGGDPGFGCNAKVHMLEIQASAELRQPAVAAVLDIVSCKSDMVVSSAGGSAVLGVGTGLGWQ